MTTLATLPPLSLYVHVPWCVRKCPYCDFNSHSVGNASVPENEYVAALIEDLDHDLALIEPRSLRSIFVGGGTPSLLSADAYRHLLKEIEARIPFVDDIEITLEANPGTFEQERFAGYREAGINRLSLGVQSFNDTHLKALGRIHSGENAENAMRAAREVGFDNINLDLMHGLPGQKVAQALADIDKALSFAPEHLSWYQLTLEPNTEFFSHPPQLPQEDTLFDIQDAGHARLEAAGFRRYEISAYARGSSSQGATAHGSFLRARHNLNYWRFGDYLGIGAGAHGKLSHYDSHGRFCVERLWKSRQPQSYLRRRHDPRGFIAGQRTIEHDEIGLEFLLNALRLVEGVPVELWPAYTGLSLDDLYAQTAVARERGLLDKDLKRIRASARGLLFLNDLLALCEPDE